MPRKRNLFDPKSSTPYALSRSKVELFRDCHRCFYLDRRLGISRPPGFPFNLNSAVDTLLKNEFDQYRLSESQHPYLVENGISAIPVSHPDLETWRKNFTGIRVLHESSGFEAFGAIDDLWRCLKTNRYIVVDYKATSKASEVSLDADWQISYKRQMEFYQWLLRRRGLDVDNTGYFVYANGIRDNKTFDNRLEFRVKVIPYEGDDDWVEQTLIDANAVLSDDEIPEPDNGCAYCSYVGEVSAAGA